jgi:hypothetical protein
MYFDNLHRVGDSVTGAQSLQFQSRPRPSCEASRASACLKLPTKLFCGETTKSLLSGYLSDFRVCSHTFITPDHTDICLTTWRVGFVSVPLKSTSSDLNGVSKRSSSRRGVDFLV